MAKIHSEFLDYDPYNPVLVDKGQSLEIIDLNVNSFFIAKNPKSYVLNSAFMELRDRGLIVIFKYSKSEKFDPIIPYLAITYFDHYFSREKCLPKIMGANLLHNVELLALCCLTLAWRIRNRNFTIHQLQVEQPHLRVVMQKKFETMELHILRKLGWSLHAVTPLCFLRHLDPTCGFHLKTASEIIIQSINVHNFTTYDPAVIAASALIEASIDLHANTKDSNLFVEQVFENILKVNAYTCFQRLQPKEKPEAQNMAEGIEDMQLDFALTWGVGVARGENFVSFRFFKPETELALEVLDLVYDPYNPLPVSVDKSLEKCLSMESLFMAKSPLDYICNTVGRKWRCRALLVMFKYSKCDNFDPSIPYLALNYFDRAITNGSSIPAVIGDDSVEHILELLALCCLTIAWKMRNRDFTIRKLQAEQPDLCVVTEKQFLTMELHILTQLEWNTRAVTALCFLQYFEPKLDLNCAVHRKTISEIIIQSHFNDYGSPERRPSVIAASALIAASFYLYSTERHLSFKEKLVSENILIEGEEDSLIQHMIKMSQKLKLFPKQNTTEESKQVADQTSEQSIAEESGKVATKGERLDIGTSSQTSKITEDREDTQLDFPLRWKLGEDYEEKFVIFCGPFKFVVPDPAKEPPDQVQGDP